MRPRTSILAASAALALGMSFAPAELSPARKHVLGKRHKSAKATKAAKLHAMQRKARKITRAKGK